MIVRYEIEKHVDGVHVWAINHRGGKGLVADVSKDATLEEIAQEFFEVLASTNSVQVVLWEGE